MELEQRVRRLERSARVWRCATVGVVLLVGILGLAPDNGEKVIECNKLIVRDKDTDSSMEVSYGVVDNKTYLSIISDIYEREENAIENKSNNATFTHGKGGIGFFSQHINFEDSADGVSAVVENMIFKNSSLWFLNSNGNARLGVGIDKKDSGYLQIQNHQDEKALIITTSPSQGDPDGPDRVGFMAAIDPSNKDATAFLVPISE